MIVGFFLVIMPVMTIFVYEEQFGKRFETPEWVAYSVSEFNGLQREESTFASRSGHLLAGYHYKRENQQKKGVVVIAHGLGGGGHNSYMDLADYFTSHGYLVFSYDATGNDKSEGDSVRGLPQGVMDLDDALRYVKQTDEYRNLPIVLFGHSWGAYSAGCVLREHPDVKAAVLLAGFNRSIDLFEQEGKTMIGAAIKWFLPYVSLYERVKFGAFGSASVMEGFEESKANVLVIHSRDDDMVLPENGYDIFFETYRDDPRFTFITYEDRGHNYVYYSEAAKEYREQLNKDYLAYVEAHGGVHSAEIKKEFMEKHLDKAQCYAFDEVLMERIVRFYDDASKQP